MINKTLEKLSKEKLGLTSNNKSKSSTHKSIYRQQR